MSEMYLVRTAYASASAEVLAAARQFAWSTGADTVCLHVETIMHDLEPETLAAQQLWHLLEQANELGAGDLILEEAAP